MQLKEAIRLIEFPALAKPQKTAWADLGCGQGTFTKALASLLHPGSTIYAIDQNNSALAAIPSSVKEVMIEQHLGDFENMAMPFQQLNGLLMANALHYVKDKSSFLRRLKGYIGTGGYMLIIEYDSVVANQWVPYPISYKNLTALAQSIGLRTIFKLSEMPSKFRSSNIYSALISIDT